MTQAPIPRWHDPRLTGEPRPFSRQELAAALDIDYQTVGYLERGEYDPSLHLAFQIAEYFELPIEAIFSRTPFGRVSEELYGQEGEWRSR